MNVNLLKAEFVKNGMTQKQVAEKLNMSEATMIRKLKKGVFGTDEASKLIELLSIEQPATIFLRNE